MIYDYFRVTDAHDAVLDYADLFSVTLHDDNIKEFDTRWDDVLLSMKKIPSDENLESLYKLRRRESDHLKNGLELYDMEIHQKTLVPNYQKLKTMVKRCIDQKLSLRNFDARHGRIESGAVVKSRKGIICVEGGKGICYQWKEKDQCSQGDRCSFRHDSQDRAQKPEHTAATPSEPTLSRGRSVSRKRSIWGKSNHGSMLRQPCRSYLKCTCTRTPCEYWHPPECQFFVKQKRVVNQEDTCLFPHYKVDEQPNKRPKRGYFPKRRESEDKRRRGGRDKRLTIGLCITRLGCTRFSRNESVSVKADAESLERNSKSSIHKGHASSREYPGEEKDHPLDKYKSNLDISEVPTL